MFYVDCAGPHDIWRQFDDKSGAQDYYDSIQCHSKILYTEAKDGKLVTIQESEAVSE
jgi:hypothetical protein